MKQDAALLAAILRNDLYSFIRAIFALVSPGVLFNANWHIEAIAYALMRIMRGEIRRLIITVPPRTLKSISASVAFPAFVLGHDPRRRIISVSYAEGLARKHANDTRAVMRSPLYSRLFPRTLISPAKTPNWRLLPHWEVNASRRPSEARSPAEVVTSSSSTIR
jgi:hypothetical protein